MSNEVKMRANIEKRLKDELIKHAREYATFAEDEVTNAWEIAGEAVDDFDTKQQNLKL